MSIFRAGSIFGRSSYGMGGLGVYEPDPGWTITDRWTIASVEEAQGQRISMMSDPNHALYVPPVGTEVLTVAHPEYHPSAVYLEPGGRVVHDWQIFGMTGPPRKGGPTRHIALNEEFFVFGRIFRSPWAWAVALASVYLLWPKKKGA